MSFTLNTVDIHAVTDLIPTEDGYVYLVRKLTPTECASLQGFSKSWCDGVPHRDAPEYKMWGNGMAFPCMLYIMEGVSEVLKQRQLDRLINSGKALNEQMGHYPKDQ